MKKFASTRSLHKILQQWDSSSREYEEIQAAGKKRRPRLAAPRRPRAKRCKMPSLLLAAPPPPKRAPSTTLTLRSKSMTAELEELAVFPGARGGGGVWEGSGEEEEEEEEDSQGCPEGRPDVQRDVQNSRGMSQISRGMS
ncbi:hypothetical protein DUI87_33354 [Hirundo rustica rustica]|uniref:Uncharacterized protein n=1 Tax=Hirundo rustica rustica TaxID=333673 RepID=A0A3M0IPD5_HIRRU|nr:hypothetical protein DUI87_33354 [Hirundo rustica rustica]